MTFGFLVTSINFNGITHCLECVKGQANRQKDAERFQTSVYMQQVKPCIDISDKEIVILKNRQYAYIGNNTHHKQPFSPRPGSILYKYSGYIIYDNSAEQNEDINRHKRHVKNTTGYQQMKPTQFMGQ